MENMCAIVWHFIWFLNDFSKAVKFTHEGKVGINLQVVHEQQPGCKMEHKKIHKQAYPGTPITTAAENSCLSPRNCDKDTLNCSKHEDFVQNGVPTCENFREDHEREEVVWLRCDVYDTGIGIPGFSSHLLIMFRVTIFSISHLTRKFSYNSIIIGTCLSLFLIASMLITCREVITIAV